MYLACIQEKYLECRRPSARDLFQSQELSATQSKYKDTITGLLFLVAQYAYPAKLRQLGVNAF
jgi:hypothetical protein